MQDYETEEQQIEALKRWWNENARAIFIGLALGGLIVGGWYSHEQSAHQHSVEASDLYVSMIAQLETATNDTFDIKIVDKLVSEYSDTPYAALTVMLVAKHDLESGNFDKAIERMQWAMSNAVEDEVRVIATLRLARLKIAQKKYDEAHTLLADNHPAAFDGMYEELKGDIFSAKGEREQARIAYDKAIAKYGRESRWLKLKRQSLGSSTLEQVKLSEPTK